MLCTLCTLRCINGWQVGWQGGVARERCAARPTSPPAAAAAAAAQGYLEGRVAGGADWTWSALRPNPVCGFSCALLAGWLAGLLGRLAVPAAPRCTRPPHSCRRRQYQSCGTVTPPPSLCTTTSVRYSTGSFMNLAVSIALYASISKELRLPLRREPLAAGRGLPLPPAKPGTLPCAAGACCDAQPARLLSFLLLTAHCPLCPLLLRPTLPAPCLCRISGSRGQTRPGRVWST